MKASVLAKELQFIIENEGDLDVDVSVAKQPETTDQQYLVAEAKGHKEDCWLGKLIKI